MLTPLVIGDGDNKESFYIYQQQFTDTEKKEEIKVASQAQFYKAMISLASYQHIYVCVLLAVLLCLCLYTAGNTLILVNDRK